MTDKDFRALGRLICLLPTVILVLCLCLCGCASNRENAAAAIQAQQASIGAAKVATSPNLSQAIADLPPERREPIERALRRILALTNTSADLLAPVIRRLTADEPAAAVATSIDQAVEDTDAFVRLAIKQTGRAEVEATQAEEQASLRHQIAAYGAAVVGSGLSQLLIGGGTGGIAVAIGLALKARTTFKTLQEGYQQAKAAISDAVSAGDDLAAARTTEEVAAVKVKHAKRQDARGTRALIKEALKNKAAA